MTTAIVLILAGLLMASAAQWVGDLPQEARDRLLVLLVAVGVGLILLIVAGGLTL